MVLRYNGKKPWYYGQNYGTILRTMKIRFTKERNFIDYQKLSNLDS